MILTGGALREHREQDAVLEALETTLPGLLQRTPPPPEAVIAACQRLLARLRAGAFDGLIAALGLGTEELQAAVTLLERDSLEAKVALELGDSLNGPRELRPPHWEGGLIREVLPLGVLFHIAAGNVDGLPAYSVVEGLLTGNVNLLKLPQADGGLSLLLLKALADEEPTLADYIHVFDTPSDDLEGMRRMAALADGIVVWGGDAAVSAVRAMAPPGVRLIEWGHKLGFAYVTPGGMEEGQLKPLARHLMDTRQLLCSSCQTILLDRGVEGTDFCRRFLPLLEEAARQRPVTEPGETAQVSLSLYTQSLEEIFDHSRRTFRGRGCSLTLCGDGELALSLQYGNPLVKCLPREELAAMLRRHKGHLQTAGLLCAPEEREELSRLLLRAGTVRVTGPGDMSRTSCCDAHDGEYPLRRYTRIVQRPMWGGGDASV